MECEREGDARFPRILLSGEHSSSIERFYRSLCEEGLHTMVAHGLAAGVDAWNERRQPVVLLDVPELSSVEPAIEAAVAIKRRNPDQFVGYLADATYLTSGLAGDAIFPRSASQLPHRLRAHLALSDRDSDSE